MIDQDINRYLPLTETTYYTLLALVEPLHGYAVMQKVESMSEGAVRIGPGTLYGAFSKLQAEGLIRLLKQDERRKSYTLTTKGRRVLSAQIGRAEMMASNGKAVLKMLR